MNIQAFFDPATWTLTYVVWDPDTRDAVVIDPVMDFDPLAVEVSDTSSERVVAYCREHDLNVHLVLDTHAHADHLSGFQHLKRELGAQIGIGSQISVVQGVFKGIFNFGDEFATDGSQWDVLFEDGKPVSFGSLTIEPIHSPGHTPACYAYKIRDAVFTGDVLFMPDQGTGRCDFPGGSATDLYKSIKRLYAMPDATRVFVGHDYQPGGREVAWETTVGASKAGNVHLPDSMSEEDFVRFRAGRDATLAPPRLIFQSLQVNANAGILPEPESNGLRYLRMPLGIFAKEA
ncbi:MAG: MBL fold metallo-hydrolase [Alphaproteobacteria bacterium]|nr:MBL fold metallo-hydrolase [Alphaproteobacteria bacterium]MCB9693120.1 MBL fold metallo-hydrolase [Alphaproteobacteria bacterium]